MRKHSVIGISHGGEASFARAVKWHLVSRVKCGVVYEILWARTRILNKHDFVPLFFNSGGVNFNILAAKVESKNPTYC